MTILSRIKSPADVRKLTLEEQRQLADDMRASMIESCSITGGHIGAGLGVVELTIALHNCFDTPRDQLVWDVGHQGYRPDADAASGERSLGLSEAFGE
jgi:1-deoxy-D-xylulose-5-phosphate synthase